MQKQPHWRMTLLRTEETTQKYLEEIANRLPNSGCPLCKFEGKIKEFDNWVLMKNKFPYDRYYTKSDMIVSKRHIAEGQLNDMEKAELDRLKKEVLYMDYDSFVEHFPRTKSIPEHVHYHLIEYRRPDGQPR